MNQPSRAYSDRRREELFLRVASQTSPPEDSPPPWEKVQPTDMPPMMFQLRLSSGEIISYPYSDLRQVRYRDAGYVQLHVLGIDRTVVTIEGRLLRELSEYLSRGLIRWIQETDERDVDIPESCPSIVRITVETCNEM